MPLLFNKPQSIIVKISRISRLYAFLPGNIYDKHERRYILGHRRTSIIVAIFIISMKVGNMVL